jgi:hypothetical protein
MSIPGTPEPGAAPAGASSGWCARTGTALASTTCRTGSTATTVFPSARSPRADVDGLRLAAEHEQNAPLRVELHDLAGAGVDRPDVVLRIDAKTERVIETVDVLAPLADELAAGVEEEKPRAVAVEGAIVAEGRVRMTRSRVNENLSARVAADAAHFADEDVVRRAQEVGVSVKGNLRRCALCGQSRTRHRPPADAIGEPVSRAKEDKRKNESNGTGFFHLRDLRSLRVFETINSCSLSRPASAGSSVSASR